MWNIGNVNRSEVNEQYANQQIVNIIQKHQNSFLPTKGAFRSKQNDISGHTSNVLEGSETQLRKQKRMRIMSNKEKFQKRSENRNLQCIVTNQAPKVLELRLIIP